MKNFELRKDSIYAPVVIPTCNRHKHLKECVESLARCTHAEKTELYISIDYPPSEQYVEGWEKVKTYVQEIKGFKKINLFFQEKNLGAFTNSHFLMDKAYEEYEYLIFTEDDNVFAPSFLDYMNKMLQLFECVPNVQAVSGFNYLRHNFSGSVYKSPECIPYGVGHWKKKWYNLLKLDQVDLCEKYAKKIWKVAYLYLLNKRVFCVYVSRLVNRIADMYLTDITQTLLYYLLGWYVVYPTQTLVKNIGYDGSGLHCVKDFYAGINEIELSEKTMFNFNNNFRHIPISKRSCFPYSDWVIKSSKLRKDPAVYILYRIMGRERYLLWKKKRQGQTSD